MNADKQPVPRPLGNWSPDRRPPSRREFLALASAGPLFGWLPFRHPRYIGLAGARFRIIRNGNSRRRFLLIHGNEESARSVLQRYIGGHDGVAFIVESHTRNIPIEGGEIDPNRMFSRAGAEASLKSLNPGWAPERIGSALALLDRGRDRLVRALFPPPGGLLVALHNNSEGYSVADEQPISDSASIREPQHPHAFFLCTEPADYRILAESPYNVVLQQRGPRLDARPDDGSLSRLAAARGVRYVNLKVELGQSGRQEEMLHWLDWRLPETPDRPSASEIYMK